MLSPWNHEAGCCTAALLAVLCAAFFALRCALVDREAGAAEARAACRPRCPAEVHLASVMRSGTRGGSAPKGSPWR